MKRFAQFLLAVVLGGLVVYVLFIWNQPRLPKLTNEQREQWQRANERYEQRSREIDEKFQRNSVEVQERMIRVQDQVNRAAKDAADHLKKMNEDLPK